MGGPKSKSKGTILDDDLREEKASGTSGEIDLETGSGHGTQYYEDGYRYSKDFPDDKDGHWTNQNEEKDSSERHSPPSDAK